jgi:hypothetical protein
MSGALFMELSLSITENSPLIMLKFNLTGVLLIASRRKYIKHFSLNRKGENVSLE